MTARGQGADDPYGPPVGAQTVAGPRTVAGDGDLAAPDARGARPASRAYGANAANAAVDQGCPPGPRVRHGPYRERAVLHDRAQPPQPREGRGGDGARVAESGHPRRPGSGP
ncbi:hypothetical protein GCM10027072_31570 [Streptomyces bullii]